MGRSLAGIVMATSVLSPAIVVAAPPAVVSNAVPYRVTVPVASGREGTALVVSRALVARDGTTTVDVATAPFGEIPTDAISSVHLRALTSSGRVILTRSSNDAIPTGAFSWTFTDLVLGEPLAIEANVADRELPRMDVVAVDDVVRRRPDLRVDAISPGAVATNVAAVITATVDEHNGDVGARANCVLFVDGIEVDRVDRFWVDAGDSVMCAFTHVFETDGSHAVRVAITDVDPGDWDASNNVLERTIDVASAFDQYYVTIGERAEDMWSLKQAWTVYNGNPIAGDDYVSQRSLTQWVQYIDAYGMVGHRWTFPLSVDMTASDDTGIRLSTQAANIMPTSVSTAPNFDVACSWLLTGTTPHYTNIYLCSRHDYAGDWSLVQLSQANGSVSYMSVAYDRYWSGDPGNTTGYRYYENANGTYGGDGTLVPFGPAVHFNLTVSSAEMLDAIDATVPIGDATIQRNDFPLYCSIDVLSWGSFKFCAESHDTIVSRTGLINVGWP